jgi:hypothetical protein
MFKPSGDCSLPTRGPDWDVPAPGLSYESDRDAPLPGLSAGDAVVRIANVRQIPVIPSMVLPFVVSAAACVCLVQGLNALPFAAEASEGALSRWMPLPSEDGASVRLATTVALEHLFVVRDTAAVAVVLSEVPGLAELLFEAHEKIRSAFGPSVTLRLAVVENADAPAVASEMILSISSQSLAEDSDVLRRLDEEWWLDAMPRGGYRLTLCLSPGGA